MLRAHGYRRTSHRVPAARDGSRASFATAPIRGQPPRRSGFGRSLLFAASLGAIAGGGLFAWDLVDPASAAPVMSFAHDALDSAIHACKEAGSFAAPYIDQVMNAVQGSTSSASPAASAHQTRAAEPAHHEPAEGLPSNEEEEKRAKLLLLEGMKKVAEEEEEEDDDVDAEAASADVSTPALSAPTLPADDLGVNVPAARAVVDHDAEIERRRALEEVELRKRLEEAEAKAMEEAERKRHERQRALEEEEKRIEMEKEEQDRKRAAAEEQRRKAAEDAANERRQLEEKRKQSLREQFQKRKEETDKLRLAALEAKAKREDSEARKLHERVPAGMLSPTTPTSVPVSTHSEVAPTPTLTPTPTPTANAEQHQPAAALPVAAAPVEKLVAHSSDERHRKESSHGSHGHRKHDAVKMDESVLDLIAASAEKAKKEVQEKYNQLLQEKEQLLVRVHAAELEAYTAHWQKTMQGTYASIAKEMSSRKYLNMGDFAHLSALFTGYISLKNALDKEQPFMRELTALKRSLHDELATLVVDSIPKSAAGGVPTLQRITTSFKQQLVPAIRQVAYTADDDAYPMPVQHLRRTFAWYVLGSLRIRSPEEITTASHQTYANAERVLAHTHEALNRGDLMSALRHIRHLPPGPVAAVGQQWAQGLHDRLVVEQATVIFDALIPPAK